MILLIDNYDSFTFNIYDYVCQTGKKVLVIKNDQMSIEEIKSLNFSKIILSPGPSNPDNAGISLNVVNEFWESHPILGICLGHQIIAQYFGHRIIKAPTPMHGKMDSIIHDEKGIFQRIHSPLEVVRYHSLIVEDKKISPLIVTSRNSEKIIMSLRHNSKPIESVQFHPEAIKTESGLKLITNFVNHNK